MSKTVLTADSGDSAKHVDEATPPAKRSRRHHVITGAIALGFVGWILWGLATNESISWSVFWEYLFSPQILEGLWVTVQLSIIAMGIAVVLGFLVAMLMRSDNPVLKGLARCYVEFFRGLPLLVLLLFAYNLALFTPELRLGFPPYLGIAVDTNALITGFTAAIIGLAIHESAFMAEVIRGGLLAVPKGQAEAAVSLGMTRRQTMLTIVMPQAIRVIVPATGNLFILMLKATALVAVIGGGDLLTMAQRIYGNNFQVIPLLFVVCFWYLLLVSGASVLQRMVERRMEREVSGSTKIKVGKTEAR